MSLTKEIAVCTMTARLVTSGAIAAVQAVTAVTIEGIWVSA
jgi:hypothetical protein